MQSALKKASQNQVMYQQRYKIWVIRVKIPNIFIPAWIRTYLDVLVFILLVGLISGKIGP